MTAQAITRKPANAFDSASYVILHLTHCMNLTDPSNNVNIV